MVGERMQGVSGDKEGAGRYVLVDHGGCIMVC